MAFRRHIPRCRQIRTGLAEIVAEAAIGNLFSAAATGAQPKMRDDEQLAKVAHLTAVSGQLDQNDVLGDPQKRSGLSEQEQCDLYTLLMQAPWTLPPRDAATAIRARLAA